MVNAGSIEEVYAGLALLMFSPKFILFLLWLVDSRGLRVKIWQLSLPDIAWSSGEIEC